MIDTTNTRSGILRLAWEFWIALRMVAAMLGSDVVALHASATRSLVFGALLNFISSITGTRVIVRCFGGGSDIKLRNAPAYMRWFEKLAFRNSLVLLETNYLCSWASNRHPRANIDWHPNCREIPDDPYPREERSARFVFLGKVSVEKGVDTILRMKERWPDDPFVIEVIGALDGTICEDRLAATPGVEYSGVMSPDAAAERLGQCQALILPTRYLGEGYPGAILEAYAQGTPVIATKWRAIPEIVADGETGLLIDVGAEDQLRDAMLHIIEDKQHATTMRTYAQKAAKKYTAREWHSDKWEYWLSLVSREGDDNAAKSI
ncbi:MAG: glycosyltransferase family 4 protein [Rhodobacterales bacterium]